MGEILIHRVECESCGEQARADRPIGCWNCTADMQIVERQIATINDE